MIFHHAAVVAAAAAVAVAAADAAALGSLLTMTRPAVAFHISSMRPHHRHSASPPHPAVAPMTTTTTMPAGVGRGTGAAAFRIAAVAPRAASSSLGSSRWSGDGDGYWEDGRPFDGGQQQQQQPPYGMQGESYDGRFPPPQEQQQPQWQAPQQPQQWQDEQQQQQQQQWQDEQQQWESNGNGYYAEGENRSDGGHYYQHEQEYYDEYAPSNNDNYSPANGWTDDASTAAPRVDANGSYYAQQQQQELQERQPPLPHPPATIEDIRRERERLQREMAELRRRENELLGREGGARWNDGGGGGQMWQQQREPTGAMQRWNDESTGSSLRYESDLFEPDLAFPTSPFETMDRFMDNMMGSMWGGSRSMLRPFPPSSSLLRGGPGMMGRTTMSGAFTEQQALLARRTNDLVAEARDLLLSSPGGTVARAALGEPVTLDERPYSMKSSTSSSVVDGRRTDRVGACLRVAGSRKSGTATVEARDGSIVSLTVEVDDGRIISVDLASGRRSGDGDIIEAEVVDESDD